ncbi:MAG: FAD-dependent monooxygenase [Hyphomicrobiaceae bacterium]
MASTTRDTHDVLIVGGSFAGLALSLALARAECGGPDVMLIERGPLDDNAEVRADPRAFALSAGSRRLLEAIGVWAAVADDAQPVSAIDITDSALSDVVRPVLLSYETVADGEPQMLILPADRLRGALVRAVRAEPRVAVVAPADVAATQIEPGARTVALRGGAAVAARLLVAADGAASPIRSMADLGVVGGSFRQRGIAAIVGHENDHAGRAVQHFLPGGPFALLPLRGGRHSCITWSEAEDRAKDIMALDDAAFVEQAQLRAGWRLGALTLEGGRASWQLGGHLARRLVAPRLALIGDSIRSVHPIAGQGVNLGFRDVAALAEALVEGLRLGLEAGDATILSRYERWRRADGVQSAAAFAALNALFSNDSTGVRAIRDIGLGLVDRLPGLKGLLVAEAAGATGTVPRLLKGQAL